MQYYPLVHVQLIIYDIAAWSLQIIANSHIMHVHTMILPSVNHDAYQVVCYNTACRSCYIHHVIPCMYFGVHT